MGLHHTVAIEIYTSKNVRLKCLFTSDWWIHDFFITFRLAKLNVKTNQFCVLFVTSVKRILSVAASVKKGSGKSRSCECKH